jgi:hypothetical protein
MVFDGHMADNIRIYGDTLFVPMFSTSTYYQRVILESGLLSTAIIYGTRELGITDSTVLPPTQFPLTIAHRPLRECRTHNNQHHQMLVVGHVDGYNVTHVQICDDDAYVITYDSNIVHIVDMAPVRRSSLAFGALT